jgi:uncharacterized protein (DUF58 family)
LGFSTVPLSRSRLFRPFARRFDAWLQARLPRGDSVLLEHRSVYILPTRFGLMFSVVLLVLLVASINYTLSLGYALTFALAGMVLVAMLHTWRNLAGLSFRAGHVAPVFAGDVARFEIHLASDRGSLAVFVSADGPAESADVPLDGGSRLILPVTASTRGWQELPRLQVHTWYPLGLFRAWSWLALDMRTLVYPRPAASAPPFPPVAGTEADGTHGDFGGWDDFWGLRNWQQGDSPRHVAWKALARSDAHLTKEFTQPTGGQVWLDFDSLAGADVEGRLSLLTRWVLDLDAQNLAFGLRLPDVEIPPGSGRSHVHHCLAALALFGMEKHPSGTKNP